ncbi:glycosyltransferase family 9 protein [Halofilum ochraceum]|uniref:glycosyltransferase family 9 protein n=1 Tax=Halofilum ochraceum TaxID=1611323 RepID=UPI000B173CCB|nr:glycosyltransferase family 9 protein [Halofilum ochraceum]
METPPSSLCLLRLSALGDVTHAVPVVRTLQKAWPETRLTWIIGRLEAELVGDLPGVEFIVFDKGRGFASYRDLYRQLRGRRFDVLLQMQVALRANIAGRLVRAPLRIGFDRARSRDGHGLFVNRRIEDNPRVHVLDGFFDFLRALGIEERELRWDIPVPEDAADFARRHLPDGERYLAINACTSARVNNWRNWSAERYAAVADYAATAHGLRTVLTGGPAPAERAMATAIASRAQHPVIDLVGATRPKELLAVLGRADLAIAPDTGPLHIAAAAGTPVIGLYATSNPWRTGPYRWREWVVDRYPEALAAETGLHPEDTRWGRRVRDPAAMQRISVDDVTARLDALLANHQAPSSP